MIEFLLLFLFVLSGYVMAGVRVLTAIDVNHQLDEIVHRDWWAVFWMLVFWPAIFAAWLVLRPPSDETA